MNHFRELRSWRRVRLSLVRERADAPYCIPPVIRTGGDVVALVNTFVGGDPREMFIAVYLDGRHRPIAVHACAVGTVANCPVHPREIFLPAILSSATAVVVAHNHPSGDPTPSPEDRTVTKRLQEAGELLGIELLDHLVIGGDRYYAFADEAYHLIQQGGESDARP